MSQDKDKIDFLLHYLEDALEKMREIEIMFLILGARYNYYEKNDDESGYLRTIHRKLQDHTEEVEERIVFFKEKNSF